MTSTAKKEPVVEDVTSEEKPGITGYRELSPAEIGLINDIKGMGNAVGGMVNALAAVEGVDKRWLAEAQTDLQKGFMSMVRSVAKPQSF